jgi:hypothetical protein
MSKDWIQWHAQYAEPGSSLARRLAVVQGAIASAIAAAPGHPGQFQVISMCAGDGRDVLPVAASSERGRNARILLVELDESLCAGAHATANELALPNVEVRCADAGVTDPYLDAAPAHVVLCCGVFGNVPTSDVRRTVAQLPSLVVPGGFVIWTRGRGAGVPDASQAVRQVFTGAGFAEIAFNAPDDATYRVGVHQLPAAAPAAPPLPAGIRLFVLADQEASDGD